MERLIVKREGEENWALGRVLLASFIVSSSVSHAMRLHTGCDYTFGDSVGCHSIKLAVV